MHHGHGDGIGGGEVQQHVDDFESNFGVPAAAVVIEVLSEVAGEGGDGQLPLDLVVVGAMDQDGYQVGEDLGLVDGVHTKTGDEVKGELPVVVVVEDVN
jgi:hypothetical protein